MNEHERLAERFESQRGQLGALAYRMLGSPSEADDAVQEAWLRLSRSDPGRIENLESWLRTVVSRLCLDMLRTRHSRREDPWDGQSLAQADQDEPEHEAVLIDSVGRAMLVVLDRLTPAERIAFVLHDLFAVPFGEIAPLVDRTPAAAKKLASRARARVRGSSPVPAGAQAHRRVVEAFLTAARDGDLEALLAVLAPDVVRRADLAALAPGRETVVSGAVTVAREMLDFGRGARFAEPALVDGTVGAVVAPHGRLLRVLAVAVADDRVTGYEVIADPVRLRRLDVAVLPGQAHGHRRNEGEHW
ncbi:MAG TPA: sigma-70 family RNA polymerase sigma factor [Amycolatopsis sp.]|jgi:RNA polymerase sigma-70 factor (ECF subfamily)|nr:sigma-70 family RNA polymerase sigma factor [Amycolatopsis sp.]